MSKIRKVKSKVAFAKLLLYAGSWNEDFITRRSFLMEPRTNLDFGKIKWQIIQVYPVSGKSAERWESRYLRWLQIYSPIVYRVSATATEHEVCKTIDRHFPQWTLFPRPKKLKLYINRLPTINISTMLLDVLNFLSTFLRNSISTKVHIVPYTYVEIKRRGKKLIRRVKVVL